MHFDAIKLSVLIFCFLGIFCEPAFASGELSPIQISPVSIGGAASSKTSLVPLSKNLDVRVAAVLHACREFWLKYRADVRRISEVSEQVRNEGFVQYFGFVFFLVFMFREKIYSIRSFFNKMMEKNPLPAYRKGGIKDEYIVRVRKILFYFCIYFIYQIIQYPLSFGSHSQVAFFADLMFQSVIVTLLLVEYFRLKRSVSKRWRGDPDRHEKMMEWLNTKLEGLQITWGEIRKITVGVFSLSFSPYLLAHLFGWLDALTRVGDQFSIYLASA